MKKFVLIAITFLLLLSCSKNEETEEEVINTEITFKVSSNENHNCEIKTVVYEVNNIAIENIENVTMLPYSKTYNEQIHFSANTLITYKDATSISSFTIYDVTLQVLKNGVVVKEENKSVIGAGKEFTMTVDIDN